MNIEKTSLENENQTSCLGAVSGRSILDYDKRIVYEMATTTTRYTIMCAYEYGAIHDFGKRANIINTLNYMTVINRLRRSLESLCLDGRCERLKYGKGYSYNFMKSLGNGY